MGFSAVDGDNYLVASGFVHHQEEPCAPKFKEVCLDTLIEGASIVDLCLRSVRQPNVSSANGTLHHRIADKVEDFDGHANSCQEVLQVGWWSMPVLFMESKK